MPSWRPERIAEQIHREVAQRLLRDIKDPELTPVSITRVQVSRDLGHARIGWLPLGGGEPTDALVGALDRAARQLRGPIGRALRLRSAPELAFHHDTTHEDAVRVTRMLDEIGKELRAADADDRGDGRGEDTP